MRHLLIDPCVRVFQGARGPNGSVGEKVIEDSFSLPPLSFAPGVPLGQQSEPINVTEQREAPLREVAQGRQASRDSGEHAPATIPLPHPSSEHLGQGKCQLVRQLSCAVKERPSENSPT